MSEEIKKDKEGNLIAGFYAGRTHQIISNHEKSLELINTLSGLITKQTTLDEMLTMDFYFNPKFSNPLHFFNDLALEGILKVNRR